MPTYDYKCEKCSHVFEVFQSITDTPLKKCPACGKNALKRLIGSGAAVIFKGSGFYSTDYKKSGPTGTSSAPSETPKGAPSCENCPSKTEASSKPSAPKGSPDGKKKY